MADCPRCGDELKDAYACACGWKSRKRKKNPALDALAAQTAKPIRCEDDPECPDPAMVMEKDGKRLCLHHYQQRTLTAGNERMKREGLLRRADEPMLMWRKRVMAWLAERARNIGKANVSSGGAP